MDVGNKSTYRVLLTQVVITHYRVPFFTALAQHPRIDLVIAAGRDDFTPTLTIQREVSGARIVPLQNRWIVGKQFLWQTGIRNVICQADIVILPFNLRILSGLYALMQCRAMDRAVVLWGHALGKSELPFVVTLRRWLALQADAVIVYSERGQQQLCGLGIPEKKVFVARNSVSIEGIESDMWLSSTPRNRILYIGRLLPNKKVDLLVRAFALSIPWLRDDVRLTIIGDGPERTRLESLVRRLGLEARVEFTGALVEEAMLGKYFRSSLFGVFPGCIGLSVIHSLIYGVPVVVADNEPHGPEIEALVPGLNSEFFRADSVDELSNAIVKLAGNRSYLRVLSKNARNTVAGRYGVSQMVEAFVAAIEFAWASVKRRR